MSQIKKLLFGETIPKAQEGYKFNLDGRDIYYSDDDLKEIGDRIAVLPPEYRRFLGNAISGIKSNTASGNRGKNTISSNQVDGLSDKEKKRASSGKPSYWSSLTRDNNYYFNEAVNAYLNILSSVADKPKKDEEKPSKTEIDATELVLDYNTKDGKKYLSPTHGNNIAAKNRVTTILQHLKDGENSKYSASKYNTDVISSWLNSLSGDDKYTAAQNFFNDLWAAMSSGNYKYDADIEDLLSNFGIKYGLSNTAITNSTNDEKNKELLKKIAALEEQLKNTTNPTNSDETIISTEQQPLTVESTPIKNLVYNPFGEEQNKFEVLKYFTPANSLGGHYLIRDVDGKYYIYHNTKDDPSDAVVGKHGKNNTAYLYAIDEEFAKEIENETIKFPTFDEIRAHSSNGRGIFGLNFRTKRGIILDKSKIINKAIGGKIDSSKINSFIAKNGGILKGQEGVLMKVAVKEPKKTWRLNEDGTVTLIEDIDEGNGNSTHKELEIPNPNKQTEQPIQQQEQPVETVQQEPAKTEPIVIVQQPNESVLTKSVPKHDTDFRKFVVEPKDLSRFTAPVVPLAKQKIAPIKGTKKYDLNDLVEVLGRIADQKEIYEKGGEIPKGQPGFKLKPWDVYNTTSWQVPDFVSSMYPEQSQVQTAKEIAAKQTGNTGAGKLNVNDESEESTDVIQEPTVGNYNYNIDPKLKYLNSLLSAGRFLTTTWLQSKYRDKAKEALNAGRFNELAVWTNAPATNMPVLDRQLQQVNQERMMGIKPVTSNFIDNFAASNMRENQLWNRENDIYTKQSAQFQDLKRQIVDIQNQNLANSIATRNQNIARQKAIDSAIKQQDLEFLQRHAQSLENLGLEVQNNLNSDINYMNNYNQFTFENAQQKKFDEYIDGLFSVYKAEYNSLDYTNKAKYASFLDYMEKVHPEEYNKQAEAIKLRQAQDYETLLEWNRRNKLNYWYPAHVMGYNSTVGIPRSGILKKHGEKLKKGGRINGHTRYTLEPDERIWIENNKATHRAIGKLSDNTIKLLLKALK